MEPTRWRTSTYAAPNGIQYDTPYSTSIFFFSVTFHPTYMPWSCNIITEMCPPSHVFWTKACQGKNNVRVCFWCHNNFIIQMNPGSNVNFIETMKNDNVCRDCKNPMKRKNMFFWKEIQWQEKVQPVWIRTCQRTSDSFVGLFCLESMENRIQVPSIGDNKVMSVYLYRYIYINTPPASTGKI